METKTLTKMKNPRFNDRTFRLLFSLLFIVIFGCTEKEILEPEIEEFQVTEQQEVVKVNDRVTTLDHKEIPEVMEGLLSKLGKTGKTILNGKLSHNNVDIDLREIKEVVNKGTNVNYSFAMDVKGRPNHIFNLIVTKMPDGTIKDPKVIGYHMKPKDMEAFFKSGEDYRNFITDYKYYRYESFFADSKFDLVGRSGDCGGGTTGGSTASSSTPPGGTFTHSYGGHTVTNIFSSDAVNIPYGYSVSIRTQNAQVSTVSTSGTSGTVQISTPGPSGTLISHNVPTSTVSVGTTSEAGASGPGTICLTISTWGDGYVEIKEIPCEGAQQKSASTAMSGDCTSPDGTFAINTAARAVQKLDFYLGYTLQSAELDWLDNHIDLAVQMNSFLIDNNFTEEAKNYVFKAIKSIVYDKNDYPSCESFEYVRLGNTGIQVAAVDGIYEFVRKSGENGCSGIGFAISPQTYYFQIPSSYGTSLGARKSADALANAFYESENWYRTKSPCKSTIGLLGTKMDEFIKAEFRKIGGTATKSAPSGWNGKSVQYKENWTGRDFCS